MFYRSNRLLLRPIWAEDWETILHGIADEGVVRNLASAPWPYSEQDARDFANLPHEPRYPRFLAVLPGPEGQRIVGCAGLGLRDNRPELGYWIARPYWGRGFATEAAGGVLEIAQLLGHRVITASHFVDNPASGKVLRKLGFQPIGQVRDQVSCGRPEPSPAAQYRLDLVDSQLVRASSRAA